MDKQVQNNQNQNNGFCLQCQQYHPINLLSFMAQFNSYICRQCYRQQSEQIMLYKKNKPTLYPSFDQIQPGLYLGNQDAASDIKTFDSTKITAICVCGDYLLTPFEDKFQYKKYEISDCPQQKIMQLFEQNFEWVTKMKNQQRHILVHCAAGVSRSASFVIAYLMKSHNLMFSDAYDIVKSKRSIIRPNSGFVKQLQEYEKYLQLNELNNG